MITEKLLFAAHGGTNASKRAAIIMHDHCLPIACSYANIGFGLFDCWNSITDVETFFELLGIIAIFAPDKSDKLPVGWEPEGLYVYVVTYNERRFQGDGWAHLKGGTLRRPTIDELEPMTRGLAPWGGVVL